MTTGIRSSGFFAVAVLATAAGAFAQAPPANDNFANRTALSGSSITFTGTLVGATYESPETNILGGTPDGGGSVWWTWTASDSTTVVIAMLRDYSMVNSTQTGFHVYFGTNLSTLAALDGNSFDSPGVRYVSFASTTGVSYQFRLTGRWLQPATFKLTATNPPVLLIQPRDSAVSPYGSALFTAAASSLPQQNWWLHPPTAYQWRFNGVPIQGEIYPSLVIHDVGTNHAGSYSVVASNAGGISESTSAMLSVVETNPVPRLAALPPASATTLSFSLTGEGGRWYRIESSGDLIHWGNPVWVRVTNETSFLSVPKLGPSHFVRAALNVSSDVCLAQLKGMRAAFDMVAVELRVPSMSTETLEEIKKLMPHDPENTIPTCPEGGYYFTGSSVVENPHCSIHGRGHEITDP